jgi:hypothetical protein
MAHWRKPLPTYPFNTFCSLDSRHVGRIGDTRARRPARLHLERQGLVISSVVGSASSARTLKQPRCAALKQKVKRPPTQAALLCIGGFGHA